MEELRNLKGKWDRLTGGPLGYAIYAVLGVFSAVAVYFFIGLILQTGLPFVAVVSGSMDHGINDRGPPCKNSNDYEENFENWWKNCGDFYMSLGISKEAFRELPFSDGFKKGDMPIVKGEPKYEVGDVIVYNALGCSTGLPAEKAPIIHRVVKVNADGTYQTKGDHNPDQISYERCIQPEQVHGRVIFIFPKIGYLKVILTELFGV